MNSELGKLIFPDIDPKKYKTRHTRLIALFESSAFFEGWIALSDEIIREYTAIRRKSKNAIDNFLRCTLKRYYRYNEDYKAIDARNILIRKYNESGWASVAFFGNGGASTFKKTHFAVTRNCLIELVQKKKFKPLKNLPNEKKIKKRIATEVEGAVDAKFHFGTIDVLAPNEVVFVRQGTKWRNAIGHALAASLYFENKPAPRIHIYDISPKKIAEVTACCKLLGIACTIEGIKAGEIAEIAENEDELRAFLNTQRIENTIIHLADCAEAKKKEVVNRLLCTYFDDNPSIRDKPINLSDFKSFCIAHNVNASGQCRLKTVINSILS